MSDYGFVYVLTNAAMPGIVKVGKTTRAPSMRAKELSDATGVPLPFEVYAAIETSQCSALEIHAHRMLESFRVSAGREFFRCDCLDAFEQIRAFCSGNKWQQDDLDCELSAVFGPDHESEIELRANKECKDALTDWDAIDDWQMVNALFDKFKQPVGDSAE